MHKIRINRLSLLLQGLMASILLASFHTPVASADLTFTKFLDADVILPGQTLPLSDLDFHSAQLVDGNIAFTTYTGLYKVVNGQVSVVADANTAIPQGNGMFTNLPVASYTYSFDGEHVTFAAEGDNGQGGIYSDHTGTLASILNQNTTIPETQVTFDYWSGVQFDGANFVLVGKNQGAYYGLYKYSNHELNIVADLNTTVPGDGGLFTSFGIENHATTLGPSTFSLNGDSLVFGGDSSTGNHGLYTQIDGQLAVVVDTNTVLPGFDSNYGSAQFFSIDGDTVAFLGKTSESHPTKGILKSVNGELVAVVDRTTLTPGTDERLAPFNNPIVDGDAIFFTGFSAWGTADAYYMYYDSIISTIMDMNTPIPQGSDNFQWATQLYVDDGDALFSGRGATGLTGIYYKPFNQPLGKIADGYLTSADLPNNQLLSYTTDGYYLITIPEPTTMAVLGLGILVMTTTRSRHVIKQ